MAKHIKMMLYGEPGVGKSVFASKAPKPFFITTDGNYEWLEDFGADPKAHRQVFSWEEAKNAFVDDYKDYDTIVVDLVEDLFKWCEQEYCIKAKLDHVSDVGYGKGYDITRSEFFLEISKLLSQPKHVILISHGITYEVKDRRGVTHTKHAPSSRLPDKVLDMIEGRLRYCLRCYVKAEETADGTLVKKRVLSLVPKENEFGIIRGVNEYEIPHDIPLDWSEFAKAIKLDSKPIVEEKVETIQPAIKYVEDDSMNIPETKVEETTTVEPEPVKTEEPKIEEPKVEEPTQVQPTEEPKKEISNNDKLAAIKAKLAAMKQANNK